MDSFYGEKIVFGCRKLTSNFYTPNKLTGLAGISTMNEDIFPIENGGCSNVMSSEVYTVVILNLFFSFMKQFHSNRSAKNFKS